MTSTLSPPQHRVAGSPTLRSPMPVPAPALPRRRSRRAPKIVAALAVSTGLWFGLTAPTVSPVAPPAVVVSPAFTVAPIVQVVPPAPTVVGPNPAGNQP